MYPELSYRPRDPDDFPRWRFPTLDFEYHTPSQSVWMYYKADGPPWFTFQTISDVVDVRESLRGLFHSDLRPRYPIRYFVMASRKPTVFNLGGDLEMFSQAIKKGDRELLRAGSRLHRRRLWIGHGVRAADRDLVGDHRT